MRPTLRRLIEQDQWRQALQVLDGLPGPVRDSAEVSFLRAQLLRKVGEPRRAIDLYQRLLAGDASLQRVRLELAQTFFEMKDFGASEHNFRLALSGRLTDADRSAATAYLTQIAQRKNWQLQVSIAVAPDSNVNASTSARQIELFGLPFELSPDARRRGGVGVVAAAAAERRITAAGQRWVVLGFVQASQYSQSGLNEQVVGIQAGPEFVKGERRWSIRPTWERGWFGGRGLYQAPGARVQLDLPSNSVTRYQTSVSIRRLDYDNVRSRDAWLYTADLERIRYLSPRAFWRLAASASRSDASAPWESYSLGRLAVGYYRTLPAGWAGYVEPAVSLRYGAAADPLFGVNRRDTSVALTTRLIKRGYSLWGFSPFTDVELVHNTSTIRLYAFDRAKVQFGLTRTF